MGAKLSFSDIVRYFFVGGCTLGLILLFLYSNGLIEKKELIDNTEGIIEIDNTIHIAIIVITIFFVGVITQGIYIFFSTIPRIRKYRKVIATALVFPPLYLCIQNFCWVLKKQKRINAPSWIFISKNPNKMISILEDFISQNTSDKTDVDMRFFNEAFAALSLVTYFLLLADIFFVIKDQNYTNLIFNTLIFFFCVFMSATFAYRHIHNIGYKCLACEKSGKPIGKLYDLCGSPVAYVLIRTYCNENRNNSSFLKEALKSVAIQTYSNVRIIVLEDITKDKEMVTTNTYNIIKEYIKEQEQSTGIKDFANRVSYSRKICNGPAGCAYYAREMFLQIADSEDVAIMLDDDDTFRREDSILDIMTQMSRYKADICLTSFQTIEEIGLNICNNGGKTHNDIVRKLSEKATPFTDYITLASSIGWTKSYKYNVLEAYNRKILDKKKTINIYKDKDDKNGVSIPYNDYYISLARYEDFPDFLTLLLKGPVPIITGVSEPTHSYRKNKTSITGAPSLDDFRNARAKFLAFVLKRVQNNGIFIKEAMHHALKFVIYKEIQICNILAQYREEGFDDFKSLNPWEFLEYVNKEIESCDIDMDSLEKICKQITFSPKDIDVEKLYRFKEERNLISAHTAISRRIISILDSWHKE